MSHITFIQYHNVVETLCKGLFDLIFNFHCILCQSYIRFHYIKSNLMFHMRQYNIKKKIK